MALAKGDKTAPNLAFFKLDKASSLNLRDLYFNNVSSECLNPKLDPALVNMLYSGLKQSIKNCSLSITRDLSQYSNTSRRKLSYPCAKRAE